MRQLDAALFDLVETCGDASPADLLAVAGLVDEAAAALADVVDQAGEGVAEEIYNGVETSALLLDGCPGQEASVVATAAGQLAAGALVAALDRLYGAIVEPDAARASAIWHDRDQVAAVEWLRQMHADGDQLHTLIIGASTAKRAIDPMQLSDRTGVLVGNAGLRGATAEMTSVWLDEIRASVEPERVIFALSVWDLYAQCNIEARVESATSGSDRRARAFAPTVDDNISFWTNLVGPPGSAGYDSSPILDAAHREFVPGTRGLSVNENELVPERVAEFIGLYGSAIAADQPCLQRFEIMVSSIEDLLDAGIEVVVVGLPALDEFAELHPEGVPGWRRSLSEALSALPEEATVIDLTASRPDEQFNDTWHLTTEGRRQLTDELADQL